MQANIPNSRLGPHKSVTHRSVKHPSTQRRVHANCRQTSGHIRTRHRGIVHSKQQHRTIQMSNTAVHNGVCTKSTEHERAWPYPTSHAPNIVVWGPQSSDTLRQAGAPLDVTAATAGDGPSSTQRREHEISQETAVSDPHIGERSGHSRHHSDRIFQTAASDNSSQTPISTQQE